MDTITETVCVSGHKPLLNDLKEGVEVVLQVAEHLILPSGPYPTCTKCGRGTMLSNYTSDTCGELVYWICSNPYCCCCSK